MPPQTTKDGWTIHKHYAEKGSQTISKCFVGDKTKYALWEGGLMKGVYDSFEKAKDPPPKTNKDWELLGREYGITPRVGESWPKFKDRVKEKLNH